MKTLILNIPETVDFDNNDATLTIAARLYEQGKVTIGQGSEMTGLSKGAFMEILGRYGVSIFNYPISEVSQDVINAKRYNR